MIIYYIGIPLLTLLAVFDATFMKVLQLWGGAPNLMLMVIVAWALVAELDEALTWAVIGGVLRDLMSVAPTGSSALAFIVIVVTIDILFPKISWRNVFLPPLCALVGTFVYDGVLIVLLAVAGYRLPFPYSLLYATLPSAIYNTVFILIIFRTLGSINAFLRPQKASMLE